jgi:hypothetical protein
MGTAAFLLVLLAAPAPTRQARPHTAVDPTHQLRALPVQHVGDALQLAASSCGIERWSVKTGTDAGAAGVPLTPLVRSIADMRGVPRPPGPFPASARYTAQERRYYEIHATLTEYKRETDYDYHLVLRDSAGRTMIAEIPGPSCVGSASPWSRRIYDARYVFNNHLTATSSFKSFNRSVTVRGVGFWDYLHGQTGVSPNGIELHPVLSITF